VAPENRSALCVRLCIAVAGPRQARRAVLGSRIGSPPALSVGTVPGLAPERLNLQGSVDVNDGSYVALGAKHLDGDDELFSPFGMVYFLSTADTSFAQQS